MSTSTATPDVDVVVIGAGFTGIYAIHRFRDRMGLTVHGFDAAADVGGTWYWNRYPGARVDIESVHYSYSFDEQLQQEWHWTERFPAQPEILRYLSHVADRFDIRKDVTFGVRVTSATWDDDASFWRVTTDDGAVTTGRYLVSGAGTLSVPKVPDFPGVETFAGRTLLTGNWLEDVDLTGQRVGIIGTGSSGIQAISEIAKQAASLTVLQRTPNYATPIGNHSTDPEQEAAEKAAYSDIRAKSRNHFLGVPYDEVQPSALAVSPEQRRAVFDDRWNKGGFRLFIDSFADLLLDKAANDTAAEYIRERIRERVQDPATAELLCPTGYPYGTKRPPLETDYYEAYNRDTVTLVDVAANRIDAVMPQGVRLADGTVHELDVLVLATGFDACTGPLLAMNVTGRDGLRLADSWADGPQTYLGLTVHGFPNFFMVTGPQSPSVLYNMPLAIEDHVDLIGDVLAHLAESGHTVVEPSATAQDQWVAETNALSEMTLLPTSASSWYMGANIPGKPRRVLVYLGGAPRYRAICEDVKAGGWRGFAVADSSRGLETATPGQELDPCFMFVAETLRQQQFPGFRAAGVETARAVVDSFVGMQAPPQRVAAVSEHSYGPDPEQRLRVYRPDVDGDDGLPVLFYVHGGGFMAGGLDVVDEVVRDLAVRTRSVVVSATYRRPPEHRFPAAHDDASAALRWTVGHACEIGGDGHRISVAGDSAGGNLAAAAAVQAVRDGVHLTSLLLVYPLVSPTAQTASREQFAKGYVIELDDLAWFGEQYTSSEADVRDPRLALDTLTAADLAGLPPTLVITNECDTLRDEGEAFAQQLRAAGVDARAQRFEGLAHGAFWMSLAVFGCSDQRQAAADFLVAQAARDRAPALA
ncbi:Predicted flavoprotein CzcO associated with the cation diffusion facilitator CzcD [Quadrisphaera granulorum]|uniref:Cation diffusion facilitator CzcD-associated flavoprotein CzcO n=1 Tax=Quadrisphaera granulorum TaxID=317664 RepID=A0A316A8Q8_9ACTN|nr:alpha/beta hydrolase fold domain-containing protein [Quadrisphaera granulorum]PWJ54135.1 cation diffusion facilitator CzcD-associated flavoprotein CzcO [Quadrisphaera granulorum]SZE96274.1 Predicted flavoprotein CzcO associated with the cation diffusion facilitator CzcD [Quadrisphaera granulorum]